MGKKVATKTDPIDPKAPEVINGNLTTDSGEKEGEKLVEFTEYDLRSLSKGGPIPVSLLNRSFEVNLATNKRSKNEFRARDFFGKIKSLAGLPSVIFEAKPSKYDYKKMKEEIETHIEGLIPNDENGFNNLFNYSNSGFNLNEFNLIKNVVSKPKHQGDSKHQGDPENNKTQGSPEKHNGHGCHEWNENEFNYPPGLELIYNYWMDEGCTSQTLQAITERYRNIRGRWSEKLLNFTLDPLHRVNNLLMGYIRDLRIGELSTYDEKNHAYLQAYGYSLSGLNYSSGLEVRSNFHSAFNKLLAECAKYFRQVDDKTIDADGFPLLIALQELNIILATGDINQTVAFAKKARVETMTEQLILERPEIGEYLKERPMVPYKHDWMRRVDTMRSIQGWNPNSIRIFNELAENGEIILLSVRFVEWANIKDEDFAEAWALFFRNEIQMYLHKYNAVTGVDLTLERPNSADSQIRDLLPSILLRKRRLQNF